MEMSVWEIVVTFMKLAGVGFVNPTVDSIVSCSIKVDSVRRVFNILQQVADGHPLHTAQLPADFQLDDNDYTSTGGEGLYMSIQSNSGTFTLQEPYRITLRDYTDGRPDWGSIRRQILAESMQLRETESTTRHPRRRNRRHRRRRRATTSEPTEDATDNLATNDSSTGESDEEDSGDPATIIECPICLIETVHADVVQTACMHQFCSWCLHAWQQRSDSCPMCRQKLYECG